MFTTNANNSKMELELTESQACSPPQPDTAAKFHSKWQSSSNSNSS